ncbi:MAG: transcriptional repressor [Alphaproteobacteria bacterium CG_4_10_14_0_8_um_filter_53_9]|nr:MAG: transcriptional repressor [Alphaproteobacteria bacterium CG_4_10_14_0_8_um_filter_53_9]
MLPLYLVKTDFATTLKHAGLSVTAVRLSVLDVLTHHPHSDASRLYELVQQQIPTVSIQAVYNNLHALVEAKIIRDIKPKGQLSRYETRMHDNHHHLVCRHCDSVVDADCKGVAPCLSPSYNHGFTIDEAEVIFWGTCPSCQLSTQNGDR